MDLKDAVKVVVENGSTVKISRKNKISEWFSEISISKINNGFGGYYIYPEGITFHDIDQAVAYFCIEAYSSKNVGLIQNRLRKKGLVTEEDNLEKPGKKLKDLFVKESKLLDKEFEQIGVQLKEFPKEEDAVKDIEDVVKIKDVQKLREAIYEFNKKYSMLDLYFSVSAIYESIDGSRTPYSSGFDVHGLTEEILDGYKNRNNTNLEYIFSRFELTVRIGRGGDDNEFKRYTILD